LGATDLLEKRMIYRALGNSGLKISSLCMGTMTFGGEAVEPECRKMYKMCRDKGVNTFDCANVYAKGLSEQILGRLMQGHRHDIVVSTKAYFPTGPSPNDRGLGRKHLRQAVDLSLARLGTDYLDIFYLHKFDPFTPLTESLDVLDGMVKQGKILYIGLSNFAAWQIERAIATTQLAGLTPIACIQPMYNLVKRQCESEILPMAQYEGLGVISYSPIAAGYLTGKYLESDTGSGRITQDDGYKRRYGNSANVGVAKRFKEYAAQHNVHPVTLAIAWVSSHPCVTAPLVGARTCEQLAPALDAISYTLVPTMRAEVSSFSEAPAVATDRNDELPTTE
jgi:aryl-alcohol dehydrogenase-like predicted oxidoreductase